MESTQLTAFHKVAFCPLLSSVFADLKGLFNDNRRKESTIYLIKSLHIIVNSLLDKSLAEFSNTLDQLHFFEAANINKTTLECYLPIRQCIWKIMDYFGMSRQYLVENKLINQMISIAWALKAIKILNIPSRPVNSVLNYQTTICWKGKKSTKSVIIQDVSSEFHLRWFPPLSTAVCLSNASLWRKRRDGLLDLFQKQNYLHMQIGKHISTEVPDAKWFSPTVVKHFGNVTKEV